MRAAPYSQGILHTRHTLSSQISFGLARSGAAFQV